MYRILLVRLAVYCLLYTGSKALTDPENTSTKIVGGQAVVNRSDYAYQISLQYLGSHRCGGSIIDEQYILTAAHCCSSIANPNALTVVAGNLQLYDTGSDVVTKTVDEIYVHEDYSSSTIANDVAILKLSEPFSEWTENINSIDIAAEQPQVGTECVVSGWGYLTQGGSLSYSLQTVTVPIVSEADCRASYGSYILDGMICAGYEEGGKDACQGDSGGPLACDDEVVGIVSWGQGCAQEGYYGVYADVAYYNAWILEKIGRSTSETTEEVTTESSSLASNLSHSLVLLLYSFSVMAVFLCKHL